MERLKKIAAFIAALARGVVTHQAIGVGEKALDVLMVWLMINYSIGVMLVIVTPIYYLYNLVVIWGYDLFLKEGTDLLGLEYLRTEGAGKKGFLSWIMKRRLTIFCVGSCVQLDPDGVTLILRKDRNNFWGNALKITLPSVFVSMMWWTTVYKLGIMGVGFFVQFLE